MEFAPLISYIPGILSILGLGWWLSVQFRTQETETARRFEKISVSLAILEERMNLEKKKEILS
jgi:hypothetical protein